MAFQKNNPYDDDATSVTGGMFEQDPKPSGFGGSTVKPPAVDVGGVVREVNTVRGYGRGPVPVDARKFKYDRIRGGTMPALTFGVTKADRLDAVDAGALLHRIHCVVGIEAEPENVILAFDKALFFEHTVNGASLLQPGRGTLSIGESGFELAPIKAILGVDQRRFFRAYADEIAEVNREVERTHDPHDPVLAEKFGHLMQVAIERGLQKYPHLAHDSSDACIRLSVEERAALMNSKRSVLESAVNNVDKVNARVGSSAGEI